MDKKEAITSIVALREIKDDWSPFSTLHGFVRLVLLIDWDPIGILGNSGAMNEYDSYVNHICHLIRSGGTREILIAHLDNLEKQQMSGPGRHLAQAEVADKLLRIYRTIQQNQGWGEE